MRITITPKGFYLGSFCQPGLNDFKRHHFKMTFEDPFQPQPLHDARISVTSLNVVTTHRERIPPNLAQQPLRNCCRLVLASKGCVVPGLFLTVAQG